MEKKDIPVQSVKRAFDLLNMLVFDDSNGEGVALSELSRRMSMRANSVHNILKTMVACGYVAQNDRGKYIAGVRCEQLGLMNKLQSRMNLSVLQSACKKVSLELGESVVFITVAGGKRVRLAGYNSTQAVRVDRSVPDQQDFYSTPTGRVLVSFCNAPQRELIVKQNALPQNQWGSIKSFKKLEAECSCIRKQGYSVVQRASNGLIAVAFPVFSKDGKLTGSIGCYAPRFRWESSDFQKITAALRIAAEEITEDLVL